MATDQGFPTVFFDRDGTLNHDSSYLKSPDELVLFPDVVSAVKLCNEAGIRVIVVTNQSGLARGYFSQADLDSIHQKLREILRKGGAWIDAIFICPHHPEDGCRCRKPNPGMIEQAQALYPIELGKSYVVGDKSIDVGLAAKMQIKGLLVTTGPSHEEELQRIKISQLPVAHVAENLLDAVEWILADIKRMG